MAAVVGALRVSLGLDSGAYEDGLKKAGGGLKSFARDAAAVATGIQLEKIFQKVGEAIGDLVKGTFKAIDAMDAMGKEAQKIGTTTEALSGLSLAASLSDVSLEQLSKSMAKLTKGMVDSDKETSATARALKALGINASEFKKLAPEKQLEVLAEEFQKTEDGATKVSIAMALFGERVGRQMIPLLNTGAKGLKEIREQAEKFNLIVGTHTAKSAENFNDNIKRLSAASQGWFNVLASLLLPRLEEFSNRLVKLALDASGFRSSAESMGRAMLFVADNADKFLVVLGAIAVVLFPMLRTLALLAVTMGLLVKAFQAAAAPDIAQQYTKLLQDMGFNTDAFTKTIDTLTGKTKDLDAELKKKREFISEQEAQKLKKVKEAIFGLDVATLELGGHLAAFPAGFIQLAASLDLVDKDLKKLPASFAALTPAAQQLFAAMRTQEWQKAVLELLPPWEAYIAKVNTLNLALQKGSMSVEEHRLKSIKAAVEVQQAYTNAGAGIAGAMGEMFTAIGGDQAGFVKATKIAMAVQALLSAYAGSAAALAGPFPANLAAAAVVLAKGLSLVAAIKGTNIGFAQGGSFMVPGSGGTDSMPVRFMATPGERVTVETPGQQRQSGSGQTIILQGRSFGFSDIRDVFEQINRGLSDGHKLKVVAG